MTELERKDKISDLWEADLADEDRMTVTAGGDQAELPAIATSAKRTKRLEPAPDTFKSAIMLIDALASACISFLICAILILLVTALLPGSDAKTIVTMCDVTIWVSLMSAALATLASFSPFIVAALCLTQLVRGVVVGNVIFDAICLSFGIDPNSILHLKMVLAPVITFSLTALPLLVGILTRPAFQVSRLRASPGEFAFNRMVGDKRSDLIRFGNAVKNSLCSDDTQLLFAISNVVTGKRRSRQDWQKAVSGLYTYKRPTGKNKGVAKQKDKVLVAYRPFEELERFVERLESRSKARQRRLDDEDEDRLFFRAKSLVTVHVILLAPLLMFYCLTALHGFVQLIMMTGFVPLVNIHLEFLEMLFPVIVPVMFWSILFVALAGFASVCRPAVFELSSKGVRFLAPIMPNFMQERPTKWSDMVRVSLEQHRNKTAVADQRLVFHLKGGGKMSLRIGSIASSAAREEILRAIERWAPQLPRDPNVIQSLQPPADHSYTDIWLEALSAPPKRDRLIPLADGVHLREGQYVVQHEIGSGGQGAAYLADDILSGERIVLKEFLLPVYVDVSVRRTALDRFENEARLLKTLDHPQVVKLLDFFIEDHRAYLVLEHIEGESLRTIVERDGALSERRVRELALQMCTILTYLHSQSPPVVHRDFTPENLILGKDGSLKLIDFNVAQQTDSTVTGTAVGKPAYLPPEQFRGQASPQSDIYAMGACLAYLLTAQEPVPISTSRCSTLIDIDAELDDLIAEATAPDAALRIKDIATFQARLQAESEA